MEPGAPEADELFVWKQPTVVELFMFAAAEWGCHRIHYDAEWARSEGFDGPVVVGSHQASWVHELLTMRLERPAELTWLDGRYTAVATVDNRLLAAVKITGREGDLANFSARVVRDDGLQTFTAQGQVRFRGG